jgi:hypothetical protein
VGRNLNCGGERANDQRPQPIHKVSNEQRRRGDWRTALTVAIHWAIYEELGRERLVASGSIPVWSSRFSQQFLHFLERRRV